MENIVGVYGQYHYFFLRLQGVNVTINAEKCAFFKEKIKDLGHIISKEGIQPAKDRVDGLLRKRSPTNAKELLTWLGMASYYRFFILQFSRLCASFHKLTHHAVQFIWTDSEELILQEIKSFLSSEPILRHPNFSFPFILSTDASTEGLGATLAYRIDGQEHVVQYISRTVQPNEKNWSIQQLEALCIIWACETVRPYIIGTKVEFKLLRYLLN